MKEHSGPGATPLALVAYHWPLMPDVLPRDCPGRTSSVAWWPTTPVVMVTCASRYGATRAGGRASSRHCTGVPPRHRPATTRAIAWHAPQSLLQVVVSAVTHGHDLPGSVTLGASGQPYHAHSPPGQQTVLCVIPRQSLLITHNEFSTAARPQSPCVTHYAYAL